MTSFLEDLNAIWDDAAGTEHEKLAAKYKALCVGKFELFFEGLTSHRRRSKRLINLNGGLDLRRHLRRRTEHRESGGGGGSAHDHGQVSDTPDGQFELLSASTENHSCAVDTDGLRSQHLFAEKWQGSKVRLRFHLG